MNSSRNNLKHQTPRGDEPFELLAEALGIIVGAELHKWRTSESSSDHDRNDTRELTNCSKLRR
jgi:hypothetical protein